MESKSIFVLANRQCAELGKVNGGQSTGEVNGDTDLGKVNGEGKVNGVNGSQRGHRLILDSLA